MPRAAYFTKETIVENGLEIVREHGAEALTARALSKKLECSISPIFTVFENMDEIRKEVFKAAVKLFSDYIADVTDYMPAFKEFGLRLIRFSKEETFLFQMLFLGKEFHYDTLKEAKACMKGLEVAFNISEEQTEFIFRHIWPFACGLALLSTQNPEEYSEETISQMISNQFSSLMMLTKSGAKVENIKPTKRESAQ